MKKKQSVDDKASSKAAPELHLPPSNVLYEMLSKRSVEMLEKTSVPPMRVVEKAEPELVG